MQAAYCAPETLILISEPSGCTLENGMPSKEVRPYCAPET